MIWLLLFCNCLNITAIVDCLIWMAYFCLIGDGLGVIWTEIGGQWPLWPVALRVNVQQPGDAAAQPLRPHLHIRSGMREPVTGGHQPIRGQLCMARTNERAGECHQSWDCHLSPPRTMGPGIPDRQLTLSIMGAGPLTKQESQSELDSLYFFLFRNTGIMGFKNCLWCKLLISISMYTC